MSTHRTDLEMVASGAWAKVGRKHYRHESGAEAVYDCNAWAWRTSHDGRLYTALWAARCEVERAAVSV